MGADASAVVIAQTKGAARVIASITINKIIRVNEIGLAKKPNRPRIVLSQ